jgi:homoserine O-acetyltransferase
MAIDAIKSDPDWMGGEYKNPAVRGLTTAQESLLTGRQCALNWQAVAPTREAAEKFYLDRFKPALARLDANDLIYQLDSSREYNPRRSWKRSKRLWLRSIQRTTLSIRRVGND